jgi:hypothetical protein
MVERSIFITDGVIITIPPVYTSQILAAQKLVWNRRQLLHRRNKSFFFDGKLHHQWAHEIIHS